MEEVNPLKSDAQLQLLLGKLDQIKKYKSFQRWKGNFLSRLEEYLYEKGMEPAEKACHETEDLLKKMVKKATKVLDFIHKGDLGEEKKTVKASLALNEMCKTLEDTRANIETLVPSLKSDEKRRGFTKFHVGAALIRQGFHQYISMKAVEDAVKEIGEKLENVADKQQHELFVYFKTQVQRFCDVMADLDLYKVMLKCVEFAEAPDDESEEPEVVSIVVEAADGTKLPMELEVGETVSQIMAGVEAGLDVPKERQVLKFNGDVLDDEQQTVESLGLKDGSIIKLLPLTIPIVVNGPDGNKIELEVDPYIYISDLKQLLEPGSGISAGNQVLSKGSQELNDPSVKLTDCGIKAGTVLDLQPATIKLNIAMPDGSSFDLAISPYDSAEVIKLKVEEETGVAVPRQVLKKAGENLPTGGTLVKEMGLKDGDTIDVEIFKIPITVKNWDGTEMNVDVEPTQDLGDIKKMVATKSGIPVSNQTISLKGIKLVDDQKTAQDHGIKAGTVLDLEPKNITVKVDMPDGGTHDLEVGLNDTSDDIKKKIEAKTGVAAARQVLKKDDKDLPDFPTTVREMDLKDGSPLTVELFKIPITVKNWDGETIDIEVEPTDDLIAIKKLVEPKSGIPVNKQVLSMNDIKLVDGSKSIQDHGINAGSILDLEPKSIIVKAKMPDGTIEDVEIALADSVDDIKKKIEEKTGMATSRQVVNLSGEELPTDGTTARDLGLKDGSPLDIEIFKIPVIVNNWDGQQIEVEVEPNDALSEIKKLVEPHSGIPVDNQVLSLKGRKLGDDSKSVDYHGIQAGTVLDLEPKNITIKVGMPDGKKKEVRVALSDTIDGIKKKIEDETGMAVPRQVVKFNGEELPKDGTTVKDMGLKNGSPVVVEIYKIPLTVKNWDGNDIEIEVEPTGDISDIKQMVESDSGIPVDNQVLSFKGKKLVNDDKTVEENGIKAGSVLTLEPRHIVIKAEMPDGKTKDVKVALTDSPNDIKLKIEKKTGMAAPRQVLKFDGEELPRDGTTAKALGLKDGSTMKVEIFKVPVTVNNWDGNQFEIMVDPTESLAEIKNLVEPESGIVPQNQAIRMNGTELTDDAKPAGDYGIISGSILDLEPKSVKVKVELPDGKTTEVELSPSDDGNAIKEKIEVKTGLEAPRQVLNFAEKEIPNKGATIKDLGIRDGAKLQAGILKIPITVKSWDDKSYEIMVEPGEKLVDMKKQLEPMCGIETSNQVLSILGEELVGDNKKISDHGIKAGSVVELEPRTIKVNAVMPDGTTQEIEIALNDDGPTMKDKIEEKTGMEAARQVLKFNDKEIKGSAKSLGIKDGSTIHVEIFKVPVTVANWDGNTIKIMVDPTEKLADIKKQLEPESGILASNQILSMNDTELNDNNKTAGAYGIVGGSYLKLEPFYMKVTVEMPDESTTSFEVTAGDTGDEMKSKVAAQTGVEASRQVLKFKGREILADSTVKGMGIQDGAVIQCELFKIPITVETYDGKTIQLQIEPVETIDGIKALLEKESGLPPRKQVLKHIEAEMTQGKQTAISYGIKKGSVLTLEPLDDKIVFVDVKCGTLFGVDRDEVIQKAMLTPNQGSRFEFDEAEKSSFNKDKMMKAMLDSPNLGVKPQIVVEKVEVEDYDVAEAEQVKNKWGVSLKKKRRDGRGEEFIFVDVKTGSYGLLNRKDAIAKKFITPAGYGKNETLEEAESNTQTYDKFVQQIRNIFGIKSTK